MTLTATTKPTYPSAGEQAPTLTLFAAPQGGVARLEAARRRGFPASVARAPLAPPWTGLRRVRVWDLPTRLFHWSLVACLAGLVATGYVGGAMIHWHARLGYLMLALLLFRVVWGFVGGRWSRFTSFLYSPRAVIGYLRGKKGDDARPGHNPLGALSVFAMLAVLLVQVGTGLVSDDEISFTGPLSSFVAMGQSLAATSYHRQVGQWAIAALVLAHVGAIVFYLLKKNDLIKPMLNGDKSLAGAVPGSRDDAGSRTLAAAVFAVCAVGVVWLTRLG